LENVVGQKIVMEAGVLRLRQDGGWARTRRILSDFTIEAEFRLLPPAAERRVGRREINTLGRVPIKVEMSSTLK
jgi:hypothetical protein